MASRIGTRLDSDFQVPETEEGANDQNAGQAIPLSMLPAGRAVRRTALAVALVSLAIFALILPVASRPLPRIDAFIPAYQFALVVGDLVTAVLLFGQYGILRSQALLFLAAGYLFTALMAVAHALTFPGLFSDTGLLGAGADSTAWIYMFWHSGFPLTVICYALLKDTNFGAAHAAPTGSGLEHGAIFATVLAAVGAAGALTLLTTLGADLLPPIMQGTKSAPLMMYISPPVWGLSVVALGVLWLRRPHSVLDVWLMVVMCAWIFEIPLSAIFNGGRFTLGYYAGRVYGLGAASFVLIVLLLEISALYARLARSYVTVATSLEQNAVYLAETSRDLRDTHDRLSAALNASPAAFIGLTMQGKIMLWNLAAERIYGWTEREVAGKSFWMLPESERSRAADLFKRSMGGESFTDGQGVHLTKDGRHIEVTLASAPLHDDGGRQIGSLYVVNDVTDKLQTERQLQQAQKMEAVGQLTGGVAHDFNNLLGIAIGNLDLMEPHLARNPEVRELAQAAVGACLRGAELTRQLLAFSRRQPLNPEAIDPGETLGNMTRLLGRSLGEHIKLGLHVDDTGGLGKLWPIVADRTQLETALLNLAVNARDAMPEGGTLSIELANAHLDQSYADRHVEVTSGDYVEIAVSDTGTGMPPEVIARAFDPFFTTKAPGRGTGLGLSMVYGFIKQSGGHIKIYSETGQGTTIKLWLPRAPETAAAADRTPTAAHALPHGDETVLVVEDNAEIRKVVLRQIRELGYRTLEAGGASEALGILGNGVAIDLLFTDVVMPGGKDGRVLAREAVELKPGLKVLFTSGFTQTGVAGNGAEPLSAPLLSKPYRKQQLAAKLREVLDD